MATRASSRAAGRHASAPSHPSRFPHHHGAAALVGEDLLQERVGLHAAHQVHAGHAAHQRGADGMHLGQQAGDIWPSCSSAARSVSVACGTSEVGLLRLAQQSRRRQQEEELLGAERHGDRRGHRVRAGVVDGAGRITRQRRHHGHIVPGAQVLEQARVHRLDVAHRAVVPRPVPVPPRLGDPLARAPPGPSRPASTPLRPTHGTPAAWRSASRSMRTLADMASKGVSSSGPAPCTTTGWMENVHSRAICSQAARRSRASPSTGPSTSRTKVFRRNCRTYRAAERSAA